MIMRMRCMLTFVAKTVRMLVVLTFVAKTVRTVVIMMMMMMMMMMIVVVAINFMYDLNNSNCHLPVDHGCKVPERGYDHGARGHAHKS